MSWRSSIKAMYRRSASCFSCRLRTALSAADSAAIRAACSLASLFSRRAITAWLALGSGTAPLGTPTSLAMASDRPSREAALQPASLVEQVEHDSLHLAASTHGALP